MTASWPELCSAPFVLIEFEGRRTLYRNPSEIIETRKPALIEQCLERLRGQLCAGFMSYEAGHALEPKLHSIVRQPPAGGPPLLWFGLFETSEQAPPLPDAQSAWAGRPRPRTSETAYRNAVARIREHIFDGDAYQVNLTFECEVPTAGHPVALYAQLRDRARANWSALVFTGTHWMLSCSPELFFTLNEGRITARPMKGTAPPSSGPEELRNDPKNRAENLMIVDLLRNDLSRVSQPGSVRVPRLFTVERYPTVLQMTSTITAELDPGRDAIDVLRAIFPCGSITGAPKIRAMELIETIEQRVRGPYTGSIGHIDREGRAEFNVAIRTLVLKQGEATASLGLGSAVVADSDAESEWLECLQKGSFVESPTDFSLFETFRLGPGESALHMHLDRLERSAALLGFPFDRTTVESMLDEHRSSICQPVRLKLSLDPDGEIRIETSALPEAPKTPVEVLVIPRPIQTDDFRLAHKTSDRKFYDEARARAATFEVIFVDEHGFLTEGSFTNLFLRKGEHLWTPPITRGLLPGILRRQLLERGEAIEGDLRIDDLREGFFIGNSLRGLIPARLAQADRNPTGTANRSDTECRTPH